MTCPANVPVCCYDPSLSYPELKAGEGVCLSGLRAWAALLMEVKGLPGAVALLGGAHAALLCTGCSCQDHTYPDGPL